MAHSGSDCHKQGKLPPLQQWKPPTLTLLDGIFQYHRTHEKELLLDNTKESIKKSFIHKGIPPHRIRLTLSRRGTVSKVKISKVNHKSCDDLLKVYRLLEEQVISHYLSVVVLTIKMQRLRGRSLEISILYYDLSLNRQMVKTW
jgi:hypothetical protein